MFGEQLTTFMQYMNSIIRDISYDFNLSPSQYFTIKNISAEGISMTDLSFILGLDNSTLTRNIKKLIDKDVVKKERSKIDKREHLVFLTVSGELLLTEFEKKIDVDVAKITRKINNQQKNIFLDIIQKINWDIHCSFNELR